MLINLAHVVLVHRWQLHIFSTTITYAKFTLTVINCICFIYIENLHLPVQTKLYNIAHINTNIA